MAIWHMDLFGVFGDVYIGIFYCPCFPVLKPSKQKSTNFAILHMNYWRWPKRMEKIEKQTTNRKSASCLGIRSANVSKYWKMKNMQKICAKHMHLYAPFVHANVSKRKTIKTTVSKNRTYTQNNMQTFCTFACALLGASKTWTKNINDCACKSFDL